MRSIIQIVKPIKIKQVLTVFLASCLLLIGSVCTQDNIAQAAENSATPITKRALASTYDDYDADQELKGGMNSYNDDRRYNSKTAAKAKTLIDTAKSRQEDNLGDYADRITDRAGNKIEAATKNIPDALQSKTEETAQAVKERSSKLKSNLQDAPNEAARIVDGATDTAQDAVEDAAKASKKTAKEIKGNFKDLN